MTIKKIIAVTGARSEYDILFPVLKKISKKYQLKIIATGAHLSENYGKTIKLIENDGFEIADKVYNLISTDEKIGRVISLGNQISGIAQSLYREKPDLVLVVGDREEAISTTLTCAYMDIAVAHIAGGDIAKDGNIDNSVRYAASKFAHFHFTILEQHKQNLLRLGEDEWRIFTVGNPALDRFVDTALIDEKELSEKIDFDVQLQPYIMLIQHPIITNYEKEAQNIKSTLDAVVATGYNCLVNYPNSDAGNFPIIEAYQTYKKKHPHQFFLFKNFEREIYINLLRNAKCLVGNSSSGLLEAPSVGLPVVNVGPRQRGRTHGGNILFVDYDTNDILKAINKSLFDKQYIAKVKQCINPYGNGKSAQKIVSIIDKLEITPKVIHKNITY